MEIKKEALMQEDKMLIKQVIDIYNNYYDTYNDYCQQIKKINEHIREANMTYDPTAPFECFVEEPILCEELFDYIRGI